MLSCFNRSSSGSGEISEAHAASPWNQASLRTALYRQPNRLKI